MNFYPQRGQRSYGNRWCDGRRDIAPSLLPVGADRHLPGGAVRLSTGCLRIFNWATTWLTWWRTAHGD